MQSPPHLPQLACRSALGIPDRQPVDGATALVIAVGRALLAPTDRSSVDLDAAGQFSARRFELIETHRAGRVGRVELGELVEDLVLMHDRDLLVLVGHGRGAIFTALLLAVRALHSVLFSLTLRRAWIPHVRSLIRNSSQKAVAMPRSRSLRTERSSCIQTTPSGRQRPFAACATRLTRR